MCIERLFFLFLPSPRTLYKCEETMERKVHNTDVKRQNKKNSLLRSQRGCLLGARDLKHHHHGVYVCVQCGFLLVCV